MKKVVEVDGLELISHVPAKRTHPTQLLFVHGAFVAAWCWDDYFLPYFAKRGFAAHALSLRGHGGSAGGEHLPGTSIDDYEVDVQRIARHIGGPLAMIGHSMGSMVVQRCLHRLQAAAAVFMAAVPPEGLLGSSMLLAARDPELFGEINMIQHAHPGFATLHGVRRAVFSDHLSDEEVGKHLVRMQPESPRAVFDLSWPQQFFISRGTGVPVLVIGGETDAFFARDMVESTARIYGVTAEIFPDTAHAMMLERNWQQVADRIIAWLRRDGT
jgi:non-heme chloroperoxidase